MSKIEPNATPWTSDLGALAVKRRRKAQERPEGSSGRVIAPQPTSARGGAPTAPVGVSQTEAEARAAEEARVAAIKADFKVFLALVWQFLNLPEPSAVQLSMADYLQHGPSRSVIMAFRGCGKSWVTGAFALWTMYCNPQEKVLVVSGSMKRAIQQTTWCLRLLKEMPLLQHLAPTRDQRQSSTAFDVRLAKPAQSASFSAFGITGQIVGQRAGLIIPDDVETNVNSLTVTMREKLEDAVREFDAILTPGGKIRFLGTPQNNDSLYNKLPSKGYAVRIWPMEYPDAKRIKTYGDRLSPYIRNRAAGNEGEPTWPGRFGKNEIERQRTAWGSSGYDLQFMLDTTLADANRFPLKLSNLIVMGLERDKGPEDVVWGRGDDLTIAGLPLMGMPGDRYYRPQSVGTRFSPWNSIKAFIDPSDKGKDEAAIAIGAELNARVFLLASKGWVDGTAPETLRAMAEMMVMYRASYARIESNFGGTMFGQLLRPYVVEAWDKYNKANPRQHGGTTLEEERAQRSQKELRIIADLEPATQNHRLVVGLDVIEADYNDIMSRDEGDQTTYYSLFHQYANLTRDKDSLAHDDRLDALTGLVGLYREVLGVNPRLLSSRREEEELEDELNKLFDEADDLQGHQRVSEQQARLSHRHGVGRLRTR